MWACGEHRIFSVASDVFLASANGQWLSATFPSWSKAKDAVELMQVVEPSDGPLEVSQERNFVIPGCVVEIASEPEQKTAGDLLALAFSLAHSNPNAVVNFWIQVKEPTEE